MNDSNSQYRGCLKRRVCPPDEMVRIHRNYESQAGMHGWGWKQKCSMLGISILKLPEASFILVELNTLLKF